MRVRRPGGSRAGEIGLTRVFLRNPAVRPEEMLETARARLSRALAGRHVLAVQSVPRTRSGDTTVTRSEGGS